jgi:hypothetical protein
VLGVPAGGEDRNTILLGKWLANQGYDVTLMGIEYAGLRIRDLSKNRGDHLQKNTKNDSKRKKTTLYVQYFLETVGYEVLVMDKRLKEKSIPYHIYANING